MLMTADDVHAQGLFDAFFRIFSGLPAQLPNEKKLDRGDTVAYCVRLCDGHYFPMPRNVGTPHSSPDKICNALCPASPTKVYTGSEINEASAADGTSYSALGNAFLYRERIISDCTCTGKDIGGIAVMDVRSDPTLRPGDIVVTKDGVMVFKGSKQVPYQTSDFIPAQDYKDLSAGVRKTLAELRTTPKPDRAVEDVATVIAAMPVPPAKPVPLAEDYPIFPIFLQ
jgi:hypothetical protein